MGQVDLELARDVKAAASLPAPVDTASSTTCAPAGRAALFASSATDAAARVFPDWLEEARLWPADRNDTRPEEKLPLGVRMLVLLGLAIAAWIPVLALAALL